MRRWRLGTVGALLGFLSIGLIAPTAFAADSGFTEETYPGLREVVDGRWTMLIDPPDGSYVATWERDEGVWETPHAARASINRQYQCFMDVRHTFVQQFDSHDAFRSHPSTRRTATDNESTEFSWWFAEDSAEQAELEACGDGREWAWDQVETTQTDDGLQAVSIPTSLIGTGVHQLFYMEVDYACEGNPNRHHWDGGAWAGYGCLPTYSEPQWVTVAVGRETDPKFPHLGLAENGSLLDPTVISRFEPRADTIEQATGGAMKQLGITVGIAAVFAILIALPTALLESTLDENHTRIGAWVRARLAPKRADSQVGEQNND